MGQKCGVDFEGQPDLVLAAEHALKPALCEWTEGRLNAFADCDDILSISRAINLGNPRAPRRPNGMEDRVAWYARVRPLIDCVEFAAGAGELAQQAVAVHPRTPEEDVAVQNVAAIVGDRILRFGDRGSDVRAVQRALARLGYGLSGTGNYGANTQAAVADFQAKHGLELDAEVGPETAKAIDAAVSSAGKSADRAAARLPLSEPPRPAEPAPIKTFAPASVSQTLAGRVGDRILRTGDAGDLVRAIQVALTKLGYDLKGTGNYGPNTQSAVADFQARHGLEVDGEVGAETAQAIDAVLSSVSAASKSADAADCDSTPRTGEAGNTTPAPFAWVPRAIQARCAAWRSLPADWRRRQLRAHISARARQARLRSQGHRHLWGRDRYGRHSFPAESRPRGRR